MSYESHSSTIPAAIETHALTRLFGERAAVENLTLSIPAGAVFGFLGPNGAGKTTTVRMLAALIAPSSGTATVGGRALGDENDTIRRSVGILTETPGLYERLTARENLVFFARLYGLDGTRAGAQSDRYLRMLGLWERRDDRVGGFSKGMRQKIAIARALLHEPAVVFLDEPTAGLDPEASRMVRDFIKELRVEGRTIFLTTHNLPEADELCDLIGVFRTRLLRLDSPANLRAGLFGRGTRVRVAGDAARWVPAASALPFARGVSAHDDTLAITLDDPDTQNPALVQALVAAGASIRFVEPIEHSLEEVYLELVQAGERPGEVAHARSRETQ
jgi:ABC-2 type transport system ATP-binding protein